ncbi:MAG: TonB-dependent receptor [Fidelibacterota bacterium]|nr:MAG: TonB-dependent receptor [Candidatus Neomarinimicrobiota bacterium]
MTSVPLNVHLHPTSHHQTGRSPLLKMMVAVSLLACLSTAYGASGRITGRVTDAATGDPLVGTNIVLIERYQNEVPVPIDPPLGAFTDVNGYFTILNVSPGLYNLRATMIGYSAVTQTGVRVSVDRNTVVDMAMSVEAVAGEEVIVEAQQPVVKPDVYGTVETITTERLAQAPFERVDEYMDKMKGIEITDDNTGHGLSIRGGHIRETDVMIDNISLRDTRSENAYLNFNTSTVEEIQVKTGGFEAKYGGIQSGLVNVITKEGSRDRYSFNLEISQVPANQPRFFGTNPWSQDTPIYKVFAGEYAMDGWNGIPDSVKGVEIPFENRFEIFNGWTDRRAQPTPLNPFQRQQLWLLHHPLQEVAAKPDYYIESALTGPLPGAFIPIFGKYAEKTTFLLGAKYESTQYAFPIGPRDSYEDWNAQLKLTTRFSPRTKLTINTMYAGISTFNEGTASTYEGAIIDRSARFNYLSNTESSVERQGRLISYEDIEMIFNKNRFQFFDKKFIVGGISLTHSLTPTSFFSLEFNYNYTDNRLRAAASSTRDADNWIFIPVDSSRYTSDGSFSQAVFDTYADSVFYGYLATHPSGFDPDSIDQSMLFAAYRYSTGAPDGASGRFYDPQLTQFVLYSHTPAMDSSYSAVYQFKGDYTNELSQYHKIETGFDIRYHDIFVYAGDGWSARSFPPSRFQYYRVHPVEVGVYFQDVLTFRGFISTLGIRAEYFHPDRDGYEVGHPLDEGFRELSRFYNKLPGDLDSYQRWTAYRETLDDPPGWPGKKSRGTFLLSPRLGASFPISVSSKMYFNYGHFYQRAPISFLYNMSNYGQIPTPDLEFEKTVSFEFGYEQSYQENYLYNVSFYYKDVQNRPLEKSYINYYEDLEISTYAPDGYKDIRGVEMRLEKNMGRFFTFWANYDYRVESSGKTGLEFIYENQLKADLQERDTDEDNPQAKPRLNLSLGYHTPRDWGPQLFGSHFLGGLFANLLIEWRDGGYYVWNPDEPNPDKQLRVNVVDFFNVDFRATKTLFRGKADLVLTVKNLLNIKRLTVANLLYGQREAYKESLHLSFKADTLRGDDKWGEFNNPLPENANWFEKQIHQALYGSWGDNSHIDIGWWEAPVFLNPRRITLGIRFKF